MPKLTATSHAFLQDRQVRTFAGVLNDSKQPFDFFICGGRQRPLQDSETHDERIPLADHPYGTKRSRQAVDIAARVSMEHHGFKQTGTKSFLWAFEHRWPHLRDHAEGRNHGVQGK